MERPPMKYRIVPIEPTEEMRTAGGRAEADERGNPDPTSAEYVYDVMLSASPNPLDDEELVEMVARAMCGAENGLDGDSVGTMLYENFRIEGPREQAEAELMTVAKSAARAVLALLDGR